MLSLSAYPFFVFSLPEKQCDSMTTKEASSWFQNLVSVKLIYIHDIYYIRIHIISICYGYKKASFLKSFKASMISMAQVSMARGASWAPQMKIFWKYSTFWRFSKRLVFFTKTIKFLDGKVSSPIIVYVELNGKLVNTTIKRFGRKNCVNNQQNLY